MNALEILQAVFEETGAPGQAPINITGLTGFAADCMYWVQTSWRWVQAIRPDWYHSWKESQETLTIGQSQYTLNGDFGITDFRTVILDDVVIWDPAVGISDQATLKLVSVKDWRAKWDLREQQNRRPTEVAMLESGALGIGGQPDKAYALRLRYYLGSSDFAANNDAPGIPEEYHRLIVYRALQLWAGREENQFRFRHYEVEVEGWKKLLQNDPRVGPSFGAEAGTLG